MLLKKPSFVNNKGLLFIYVITGSFVTIFQRYLTFHFDSLTQNFYRFLTGSVALLLIGYIFYRDEQKKLFLNPRESLKIAGLAALNALSMFLWVKGLAMTSAALGGLMGVLGFPLLIVLAALFFRDERSRIKNPVFLIGICLVIIGTVGLTLGKNTGTLEYSTGVLYLLVAAIISPFLGLFTKKLVITSNPICIGGLLSLFMSIFFLAAGLLWGDLGEISQVSTFTNVILFGSGAYGILIGIGLAFVCIKKFGVVISRLMDLIMPIFIALNAYIFFREALTLTQLIFGTILLGGCLIALLKSKSSETV